MKNINFLIGFILIFFVFKCNDEPISSDGEKPYFGVPEVSIIYPADNSEFPEDSIITIRAEASDNDFVKEVKFYINDTLEYTDLSTPYEYNWDTRGKAGNYRIQVKAIDSANNTGESDFIAIAVIEPYLTDVDGNIYQIVKIGTQWWMAENLKVTHYRDGTVIPYVADSTQWSSLSTGALCNYDNDTSNVTIYGRLYNWYAVNNNHKLAPHGWHVPEDYEWRELEKFLGMSDSEIFNISWRGTDEGGKIKEAGTAHWLSPNYGATNLSGFTALPNGYRDIKGNSNYFYTLTIYAHFWTASNHDIETAVVRCLGNASEQICRGDGDKRWGYGVRCIRD